MAMMSGPNDKKNLNVELNLLPVFDVLSVCICFLLMTVVWVEIRSVETKQSIGSQSALENTKLSSVWLSIDENNNLTLTLKSTGGGQEKVAGSRAVPAKQGAIDWVQAKAVLAGVDTKTYQTAHILPARTTKYDQVIHLMDLTKQMGISDIGLSPI